MRRVAMVKRQQLVVVVPASAVIAVIQLVEDRLTTSLEAS